MPQQPAADAIDLKALGHIEGWHLATWLIGLIAEVEERVGPKEANVCRIRVTIWIGEMRHNDLDPAAGTRDAMQFCHQLHEMADVFQRVTGIDLLNAIVRQQ